MVVIDELEKENKEIVDLAMVLSTLVDHAELRSNPVFCEMLQRFMDRIHAHLSHEARSVYSDLLSDREKGSNDVASRFISNAHALNKIINGYTKRWCSAIPTSEHHQEFVDETQEVFSLLNERIHLESKHLFPMLQHAERPAPPPPEKRGWQ